MPKFRKYVDEFKGGIIILVIGWLSFHKSASHRLRHRPRTSRSLLW